MMDDTRSAFYYIIILSGVLVLVHIHYRKNTIQVESYTKAVSHPYYKYPTIVPISNWSQLNESNPEEFLRYKPLSFRHLNSPASPISDQIQCSRILANDQDYIKNWTRGPKPDNQFNIENNLMPKNRVTYTDEDDLQTDCGSIKKRNYFMPFPNSIEEAEFPIAFARHVNQVI
uniref:Uncharacterized protein n=1 Tax=Acrobeloides nanus TaxID=290746 RepID=A0A914ESA0_9BILA